MKKEILTILLSITKIDKKLGLSVSIIALITFIVLRFAPRDLFTHSKMIAMFIGSLILAIIVLRLIIEINIKTIKNILSIFTKTIPTCEVCNKNLRIFPNRTKNIYYWSCVDYSNENHKKVRSYKKSKSITIRCNHCCKNKVIALKNSTLKCTNCQKTFTKEWYQVQVEKTYAKYITNFLDHIENNNQVRVHKWKWYTFITFKIGLIMCLSIMFFDSNWLKGSFIPFECDTIEVSLIKDSNNHESYYALISNPCFEKVDLKDYEITLKNDYKPISIHATLKKGEKIIVPVEKVRTSDTVKDLITPAKYIRVQEEKTVLQAIYPLQVNEIE